MEYERSGGEIICYMSELEQYIHSYFGITQAELVQVVSFFQLEELPKAEFYVKAGR